MSVSVLSPRDLLAVGQSTGPTNTNKARFYGLLVHDLYVNMYAAHSITERYIIIGLSTVFYLMKKIQLPPNLFTHRAMKVID